MEKNLSQNQIPESIVPIENPKKPFPFKWLSLGAGLILILIIFASMYFLSKNSALKPQSTQPTPAPTATNVNTSTWNTYENIKYGYSVKYPSTLEKSDKKGNDTFSTFDIKCESSCGPSFPVLYISAMDGQTYNEISTDLIDRISKLELSETIETQRSPYPTSYWTFKRVPDLRILNQNALTIQNDNVWEGEKGTKDIRVFIKNNGVYFELGTYYKTPEELMVFKAFLSTFKFADETANLETYINSDSNWQIDYPKDLKILEREATHIGPTGLGKIIIFSKLGLTQTEGTELHDGIAFTVGLAKKDSNQSIRDFADQQTKPDENINSTRTPLKEITINGRKGIEATVSSLGTFRIIYLEYPVLKDRVYSISILSEGPQKETFDKIVKNMLSSFKSYR